MHLHGTWCPCLLCPPLHLFCLIREVYLVPFDLLCDDHLLSFLLDFLIIILILLDLFNRWSPLLFSFWLLSCRSHLSYTFLDRHRLLRLPLRLGWGLDDLLVIG